MTDILLSASVPLPDRDRRFFETADVLAIREAVKALVEVVLPVGGLTFGGHPAITPLVALFVREGQFDSKRVTVFQSALFSSRLPPELADFVDVRMVPAVGLDRDASLRVMREEMINSRDFAAAVVIGGMEGVYEEVDIFTHRFPGAVLLPLASTGAAAAIVHRRRGGSDELEHDMTYPSLFRRRLPLNAARDHRG